MHAVAQESARIRMHCFDGSGMCWGGSVRGGCAVDVTVNIVYRGADRNKSLLAFVLNYEWMGWKFVCICRRV